MEPKVITDKAQYEQYLSEVASLVAQTPSPGTSSFDRLHVLAVLVEKYEDEHFEFEMPTPIEAIIYRMEEQGLKQVDLIPFIGSKSKVSEVLSGKRPLTLPMIKALHEGLGISAEVLLGAKKEVKSQPKKYDLSKFPIREMLKRGWINENPSISLDEAVERFFRPLFSQNAIPVLWRRSSQEEISETKHYALAAWSARVINLSNVVTDVPDYDEKKITRSFLKELGKLSAFYEGPLLAIELLKKNGIITIVEPHLPTTKIDGATFFSSSGNPVIALTLRFDRLDYFWFTLMHELVHVMRHLNSMDQILIDDYDFEDGTEEDESEFDLKEKEADFLAKEAFIPRSLWLRSDALKSKDTESIIRLSRDLGIHPAIIAGRIRKESKNFKILGELLGEGKVRNLFLERK